jgi:hypothetical protein
MLIQEDDDNLQSYTDICSTVRKVEWPTLLGKKFLTTEHVVVKIQIMVVENY